MVTIQYSCNMIAVQEMLIDCLHRLSNVQLPLVYINKLLDIQVRLSIQLSQYRQELVVYRNDGGGQNPYRQLLILVISMTSCYGSLPLNLQITPAILISCQRKLLYNHYNHGMIIRIVKLAELTNKTLQNSPTLYAKCGCMQFVATTSSFFILHLLHVLLIATRSFL